MISLMWDRKQKVTNEQPKQTNSHTDSRMVVTREEGGWEEGMEGQRVKYVVTGGNEILVVRQEECSPTWERVRFFF